MSHPCEITDAYYGVGAVLSEVGRGLGKLDEIQIRTLERAEDVLGKLRGKKENSDE